MLETAGKGEEPGLELEAYPGEIELECAGVLVVSHPELLEDLRAVECGQDGAVVAGGLAVLAVRLGGIILLQLHPAHQVK